MPIAMCSPFLKNERALRSADAESTGTVRPARSCLRENEFALASNLEMSSRVCLESSSAISEDNPVTAPHSGGLRLEAHRLLDREASSKVLKFLLEHQLPRRLRYARVCLGVLFA
jgi:hypothetical protein